MRILVIVALLQVLHLPSYGQYWNGETLWIYQQIIFFPQGEDFIRHERVGDTIIHNRNCQIFERQWYTNFADSTQFRPTSNFILHAENNMVNYYHEVNDTFYLMYDFNLMPGDTMITHCMTYGPEQVEPHYSVVDSISYIQFGNEERKVQHLRQLFDINFTCEISKTIIEGIGPTRYLFPSLALADPGDGGPLVCFRDENLTYPPNESCEVIVNIDDQEKIQLKLYPNPSCEYVKIAGEVPDVISLYDNNGILLKRYDKTNIIETQNLELGIYTLRIKVGNNVASKKIVKSCF